MLGSVVQVHLSLPRKSKPTKIIQKIERVNKAKNLPLVSICICNFNMGRYIYDALNSVCMQLDSQYEVVVIDDGSSDNSLDELNRLKTKYNFLKIFPYARDSKRMLGATRNLSIKHSLGKYVVLHIDADDIWEDGIHEWCENAIKLSLKFNDEVFISGNQINFTNKRFIEDFGGYKNMGWTEDRDLWMRLASKNKLIFVNHPVFRKRMPLVFSDKLKKFPRVNWQTLQADLRSKKRIVAEAPELFFDSLINIGKRGIYNDIFRIICFIPGLIVAIYNGSNYQQKNEISASEYQKYKSMKTKSFDEWLRVD